MTFQKNTIDAKESVAKMLKNDQIVKNLDIELILVEPGSAQMKMRVTDKMLNGHQICHGGMIFTLADTTFSCASNSFDRGAVAQGCEIEFLSPAFLGDVLTAQARERKRGRRVGIYDVEVFNQEEKLIALFRGKAFFVDRSLSVHKNE